VKDGPQDHVNEPPSRVTFLRHGESVLNLRREGFCFADEAERNSALADGLSLANQDTPLTPRGVTQSERAGERLYACIGIPSVIYCSPHLRARQTLDAIKSAWPKGTFEPPVIYDTRVRERESAPVSMMTQKEVQDHFPWLQWYHGQVGNFYFRYPMGESLADVVDGRARQFIFGLNRKVVGDNVLVVTHGNFMRCSRFILERWDPEDLRGPGVAAVPNCGILRYELNFAGFARSLQLVAIE